MSRGQATSTSEEVVAGCPLDGAKEGRLRWAVNSNEWTPAGDFNGEEFQYLLSLIHEPSEREAVDKFVRFVDQKRAVISRLLVRRACAAVLGFQNFRDIEIARTKGKKPFLRKPRPPKDRPDLCNFNFNVSHEGEWVIFASEPLCLCGVDVAAPHDRRPGGKEFDVFETFKEQLTEDEWRTVELEAASAVAKRMAKEKDKQKRSLESKLLPTYHSNIQAPIQDAMSLLGGFSMDERRDPSNRPTVRPLNQPVGYQVFQRFWSAKEAFVKARGDGLGFELNRVEMSFTTLNETVPTYVATVAIDGKHRPHWRCFQERLGQNHWATVARGPTDDVVDAHGEFTRTLERPTSSIPFHVWEEELFKESPRFQVVPIGFLVPFDDMAGYVAAGGTPWPKDSPLHRLQPDAISPEALLDSDVNLALRAGNAAMPASPVTVQSSKVQASALVKRGKEHFKEKEYLEALECYTSAIELTQQEELCEEPTENNVFLYDLLCKRAACHIELQDFASALSDANKAVEIDTGTAEAYFQRGRALEGLGSYAQALECLQCAREIKREGNGGMEQLVAEHSKVSLDS